MSSKLRSLNEFIRRKKLIRWTLVASVVMLPFFWYYLWSNITDLIDGLVDNYIKYLAHHGMHVSCEDRSFSGYPLGLTFKCNSPKLILNESVEMNGESLKVTFDIPSLDSYVFELDGPVSIHSNLSDYGDVSIDWDQFQLVLETTDHNIIAVLINLDSAKAVQKLLDKSYEYNLAYVDIQIRDEIEEIDKLTKFFLKTEDFNLGGSSVLMKNVDLEFALRTPYSEILSESGIFDSFNNFQQNGGNLELNHFKFDSMGVVADFGGNLFVPPSGVPSGKLSLWISGAKELISFLDQFASDEFRQLTGIIPSILSVVPKEERNGLSGIKIPVTIKNGRVQVGIVPLGSIPSLFTIFDSF